MDDLSFTLYAIRTQDGWFSRRGITHRTSKEHEIRIYQTPGPAKAMVTVLSKRFPELLPQLVEFEINDYRVVDQTERLQKVREKADAKNAEAKKIKQARNLEDANRALAEARRRVDELTSTMVNLSAAELSVLTYLLDALRTAPQKTQRLLELATKPDASGFYKCAIEELRSASDIVEASKSLRRRLWGRE